MIVYVSVCLIVCIQFDVCVCMGIMVFGCDSKKKDNTRNIKRADMAEHKRERTNRMKQNWDWKLGGYDCSIKQAIK